MEITVFSYKGRGSYSCSDLVFSNIEEFEDKLNALEPKDFEVFDVCVVTAQVLTHDEPVTYIGYRGFNSVTWENVTTEHPVLKRYYSQTYLSYGYSNGYDWGVTFTILGDPVFEKVNLQQYTVITPYGAEIRTAPVVSSHPQDDVVNDQELVFQFFKDNIVLEGCEIGYVKIFGGETKHSDPLELWYLDGAWKDVSPYNVLPFFEDEEEDRYWYVETSPYGFRPDEVEFANNGDMVFKRRPGY